MQVEAAVVIITMVIILQGFMEMVPPEIPVPEEEAEENSKEPQL